MGRYYKEKVFQTEEEKFKAAMKAIGNMADEIEDVYTLLIRLARVTDDEWKWILGAKKTITSGVCALCVSAFQTERKRDLDICNACRNQHMREVNDLNTHRLRARNAGLPETLSLPEWLATIAYFQNCCAYCLKSGYECMDHYVPLCLNGGTVADNCVPSCRKCNWKKGRLHPSEVVKIPKAHIERVGKFLTTQANRR